MSGAHDAGAASEQFYAALNSMANGDASAMDEIWEQGPHVTVQHPIGGRSVGWTEIAESWRKVASISSDGRIELKDQQLGVLGDTAIELGVEHVGFKLGGHPVQTQIRVTNVYRRTPDGWKIVHHHTDPSPEMQAVLAKL